MNTCQSFAGKGTHLRSLIFAALLVMSSGFAVAQQDGQIELNPSHPETYTVKKGDTLWDISGIFLKDPWYWPEIWHVNPQVENPHLIYPGDVLRLVYVDGQPRLVIERGSENRLSPTVRSEPLDEAVTSIAFTDIKPFLAGGMILSKGELKDLPYINAFREHLIAGAGNEVFATGMPEDGVIGDEYALLRQGDKLRDPENGDMLGYEVMLVGLGELRANGDPATIFLTKTNREILRGDKVRKIDLQLPLNFFPKGPDQEVKGQIVSVIDSVSRIGQYQMVILNRGEKHGVSQGTVLAAWRNGEKVEGEGSWGKVKLPDDLGGHLMVVKAYENISYAMVMEAQVSLRVGDIVKNP
jgi:hypothetical protein